METQAPYHHPPTCLIWVFAGDSGCDDMASGNGRVARGLKRNGRHPPRGLSIQKPDILQPVQRHTHGDLKSRSLSHERVSPRTQSTELQVQ